MFYVNDEPESKFLYTETIKLYCVWFVLMMRDKNVEGKRNKSQDTSRTTTAIAEYKLTWFNSRNTQIEPLAGGINDVITVEVDQNSVLG